MLSLFAAAAAAPLSDCTPDQNGGFDGRYTCGEVEIGGFFHDGAPEETPDGLLDASLAPFRNQVPSLQSTPHEPFTIPWRGGEIVGMSTVIRSDTVAASAFFVAVFPWNAERHLLLTCTEPEGGTACVGRIAAVAADGLPVPLDLGSGEAARKLAEECRWEGTDTYPINVVCPTGSVVWMPLPDASTSEMMAIRHYMSVQPEGTKFRRFRYKKCEIAHRAGACVQTGSDATGWEWIGYRADGAAWCSQSTSGPPSALCSEVFTRTAKR